MDMLEKLVESGADTVSAQLTHYPQAKVLANPVDVYRVYLADLLTKLTGCDATIAYDAIQTSNSLTKGDLTVPVPRLRLKTGKKPQEQSVELASQFPKDHVLFLPPTATGIHLPLYFAPKPLSNLILPYIFDRKEKYGSFDSGSSKRKKVVIDFSSPNIAKEFHAGHLRSTIIGAFIANLYASMGWDVVRLNYLGDWGKQFGLLAVGWQRFGSEEQLAREPLKHLLDVYARIHKQFAAEEEASREAQKAGRDTAAIESQGIYAERNAFFARMEAGEDGALALWRRFRAISIERYVETYGRLNIQFDEYGGESQVQATTIKRVEQLLTEQGVYEEDDGAWVIDFKKHGAPGLGVAVARGRTGTTTYLLRDVAAALERDEKYDHPDKLMYVVSSEQDLYFQRVFKVVELMGRANLAKKMQHVNFGRVMGMSSRLGNVKLLSDILDQTAEAMHEVMRGNETKYAQIDDPAAVADAVGISAVMVQDMTGKRINNYPFDMERMTSFEGDTGPYLQYCHARLNSILRKASLDREVLTKEVLSNSGGLQAALQDDLAKPHCVDLLRLILQYPDVTTACFRNLEPSTILTYLFRLTHQLSSSYDVLQVVGAPYEQSKVARAAVYESARQVLENGMRLLGLTPVNRM